MSDINELIARNAIQAYNSGLQYGISIAHERIMSKLEADPREPMDYLEIKALIEEARAE